MVTAVARRMVHRLRVPTGLWIVALGRLLHLRESCCCSRCRLIVRGCMSDRMSLDASASAGLGVRNAVQLALDVLSCESSTIAFAYALLCLII